MNTRWKISLFGSSNYLDKQTLALLNTIRVWSNTNLNGKWCNDAMARKFLLTSCILDNSHKSAQHIPTVTSTSLHDLTFCSKKSTSLPSKPWSGRSIHMHLYVFQSSNPPFPAISEKKKHPKRPSTRGAPPQNLPSPWQSLGNVSWPGREWLFWGAELRIIYHKLRSKPVFLAQQKHTKTIWVNTWGKYLG